MKYLFLILSLFTLSVSGQTLLPDPSTPTTKNINAVLGGYIAMSGTNTYTGSLTGLTTYTGFAADLQFANKNTSTTCTVNINSLGAKALKKYSTSGVPVSLDTGDIKVGKRLRFYYNGSLDILIMMGGSGGGTDSNALHQGSNTLGGDLTIKGTAQRILLGTSYISATSTLYSGLKLFNTYGPYSVNDTRRHQKDSVILYPGVLDVKTESKFDDLAGTKQDETAELIVGDAQALFNATSHDSVTNLTATGGFQVAPRDVALGLSDDAVSNPLDITLKFNLTSHNETTIGSGNVSATGNYGVALGSGWANANGNYSFAGGRGFSTTKSVLVGSSAQSGFGWYETTTAQTAGHGALAPNSAILGGLDANIPSNANGSVVLGGSLIKVSSGITNTTHTQNLRIGSKSYFGGFSTTPTALIHIGAGTATASTAPLKLTSGTVLTTPEVGAIEYDGSHFYGTVTGPSRVQLDNTASVLTTDGDLAIRASGANTRLGIGSTNKVLTVIAGLPSWQTPTSGFADPLTTDGDIIARVSGSTTRLAKGADGTFLGVSSGTLGYYTPSGGSGWATSGTTVVTTPKISGVPKFDNIVFDTSLVVQKRVQINTTQGSAYGNFYLNMAENNLGGGDPQFDDVMMLGYNTSPGGGRVNTNDGEMHLAWESHFNGISSDDFEFHLQSLTRDGLKTTRHFSTNIRKDNGDSEQFWTTGSVEWRRTSDDFAYFLLADDGSCTVRGGSAVVNIDNQLGSAIAITPSGTDGTILFENASTTTPDDQFQFNKDGVAKVTINNQSSNASAQSILFMTTGGNSGTYISAASPSSATYPNALYFFNANNAPILSLSKTGIGNNSTVANTNATLTVTSDGVTTGQAFSVNNSSSVSQFKVLDNGKVFIPTTPTNNDTINQILVRDFTTGEIKYSNKGSFVNTTTTGLTTTHHLGGSGTVSVSLGAGAGSGGSPSFSAPTGTSDLGGRLDIGTGTSPTGSNAIVLTLTFATAYAHAPFVVLTPASNDAAALTGVNNVYTEATTTNFVIKSGATGLNAGGDYRWFYHVIQ